MPKSTKLLLRPKESRMKRKKKSKSSERCKRKLLIDKPKSMLSEPRELMRRKRDKPDSEKSSSTRRDNASLLILRRLDKDNSKRSR